MLVLLLVDYIAGHELAVGLVVGVTIMDAIWGVTVSIKKKQFALFELARLTIGKLAVYGCAMLAFIGLVKNDGTIDTSTYLTTAPVTSVNGQTGAVSLSIPTVPSNLVTGKNSGGTDTAYTIQVVSALPGSPDSSTIYLITGL